MENETYNAAVLGLVFCLAGLLAVVLAAYCESPRRNPNRRRK